MKAREYEQIIEELIRMLDEGVYIVDAEGKGIFYNAAMASMEKINMDDVMGQEFNKAFPGIPLENSTMYQALRKRKVSSHKQQTYLNLYKKEITTENSTRPVIVDGKVVAAVEVARDITDLRTMTDTILELQSDAISDSRSAKRGMIRYTFSDLIGENPRFREIIARANKAAENDAAVIIYGETGTGKELFAQSIHYASKRKEKPFIAQNCAAIPESLLEGILFGTSKGGFTGAVDREGIFEQATGGTILLDEISAMPYDLQSKLLRVLQENYIRRVGGIKDIPIDVRIVATVNEDPLELMKEGKLRRDLYYRLNVINITIPPLRSRKNDIDLLSRSFLAKYNERFGKAVKGISPNALKKLMDYEYPGNVRELENIIERAVSMCDNEDVLGSKDIQIDLPTNVNKMYATDAHKVGPLNIYMEKIETEIIRDAMIASCGNISRAADMLQIKRQTLQHKLKKLNIVTDAK